MAKKKETIDRILRLPEVIAMTGLQKATIYRYIQRGDFPVGLALSGMPRGPVGWRQSTVQEWIRTREQAAAA